MKNLKLARKNSNLTQKEVAQKLGIPTTTYANYEQIETSVPPIETLLKMCELFDCSTDYLFGKHSAVTTKMQGFLRLDSFTPIQQKLIQIISKLTPDQTLQAVGYFSGMLNIPFEDIKPTRPW